MTLPASVEGCAPLRLFVALTLPPAVLSAIEAWQQAELVGHDRIVPREHLHLTLAFLGSRPSADAALVAAQVRAACASLEAPPVLEVRAYRETRSVGMLVLADEGGRAAALAEDVQGRLEQLGMYAREARPWLPHVTVLRFRRPPRLRPSLPDLGAFSPSGAAVYHSLLRPGGARYVVLDSVALGG